MAKLIDARSLRFRVLLLAAAAIGVTLIVAGLSVKLLFAQHMQRRIASELETRLADLAGAVAVDPSGGIRLSRPLGDPRYEQPLSGAYWQVTGDDAKSMLRSRSLWDEQLSVPAGVEPTKPYEITSPDGAELYALARSVTLGPNGATQHLILAVGLDHRELEALSEAFGSDLNLALGAIALALFGGALLQLKLGMAPLQRLHGSLLDVRAGKSPRLIGQFPSEVEPLAQDLNRLLDRHEALLEKARERAGALAHGFKTPLTILTLEARKLADRGETAAARVLRDQTETMRRHVEQELARVRVRGAASSDSALGAGSATDVAREADRLADLVRRMPRADGLTIRVNIEPGVLIQMDRYDFGEVLGNLLDNARKWASSKVDVEASQVNREAVVLSVTDDGPGLEETAADRTERNAEGAGLGLKIVADVLEAYNTRLCFNRVGGMTKASVLLRASSKTKELGSLASNTTALDLISNQNSQIRSSADPAE